MDAASCGAEPCAALTEVLEAAAASRFFPSPAWTPAAQELEPDWPRFLCDGLPSGRAQALATLAVIRVALKTAEASSDGPLLRGFSVTSDRLTLEQQLLWPAAATALACACGGVLSLRADPAELAAATSLPPLRLVVGLGAAPRTSALALLAEPEAVVDKHALSAGAADGLRATANAARAGRALRGCAAASRTLAAYARAGEERVAYLGAGGGDAARRLQELAASTATVEAELAAAVSALGAPLRHARRLVAEMDAARDADAADAAPDATAAEGRRAQGAGNSADATDPARAHAPPPPTAPTTRQPPAGEGQWEGTVRLVQHYLDEAKAASSAPAGPTGPVAAAPARRVVPDGDVSARMRGKRREPLGPGDCVGAGNKQEHIAERDALRARLVEASAQHGVGGGGSTAPACTDDADMDAAQ